MLRKNRLAFEGCSIDLVRTDSLEVLNISGCGITSEGGAALVEVLKSGCVEFETLVLDVSNNDFGEAVGEAFEAALKSAPFIVDFDARMCNFSGQSEYSIHESTLRNKERRKKEVAGRLLDRIYSMQKLFAIS
ncbi:uncharacterized protein LOC143375947 isoform X3 [Andrena cerasifolii]|uniref:uncharacterized protein LOC143375947 isoform X3 n=1 Tax=Andrena cerasifolii TaxID=2819439 RepID=UPI004037A53B